MRSHLELRVEFPNYMIDIHIDIYRSSHSKLHLQRLCVPISCWDHHSDWSVVSPAKEISPEEALKWDASRSRFIRQNTVDVQRLTMKRGHPIMKRTEELKKDVRWRPWLPKRRKVKERSSGSGSYFTNENTWEHLGSRQVSRFHMGFHMGPWVPAFESVLVNRKTIALVWLTSKRN